MQAHGFVFENRIVELITNTAANEYRNSLPGKYSAEFDIAAVNGGVPYSIKVSKGGGSIGCGDIIRFYLACKSTPFCMIVGSWRQCSGTKLFYEITEVQITPDQHETLWGRLPLDKLVDFVEYVKAIPSGPAGQLANKALWKQKREQLYSEFNQGLVSINAKIDSKKQRRVQAAMKLQDIIISLPSTRYIHNYKGIPLPYAIDSAPRTFKKP